jgi:type III secretory pathway component EscU
VTPRHLARVLARLDADNVAELAELAAENFGLDAVEQATLARQLARAVERGRWVDYHTLCVMVDVARGEA